MKEKDTKDTKTGSQYDATIEKRLLSMTFLYLDFYVMYVE